jgi:hypothetical protein
MSAVNAIIELLRVIDSIEENDKLTLINAVVYLANDCLTGEDRESCENIEKIRKAGFDVHAGEQDRFGWLSGVIEMKTGRIIFG